MIDSTPPPLRCLPALAACHRNESCPHLHSTTVQYLHILHGLNGTTQANPVFGKLYIPN